MPFDLFTRWAATCLLLGLRIAPVFAFAPPFSLIRTPRLFHALFGLGLATCLASGDPRLLIPAHFNLGWLVLAAIRELALGCMFVLAFQLVFAALYLAGRTIDVQAGFGLALLIDPTTRGQIPLVGTLFAYAAGAIFFGVDGHIDLLRLFGASIQAIPPGQWSMPHTIGPLASFISTVFLTAFGVAGAAILALFLADLVIALLSRTVPQMNVLVLGFQVKTILLLLVLPASFGLGGALLIRLTTMMLQAIPRLL
jgi:flagellar biosynthetic protein FliR